jgi:hypothetical protein
MMMTTTTYLHISKQEDDTIGDYKQDPSRRDLFKMTGSLGVALAASTSCLGVKSALAADDITSSEILLQLRAIPTFCIVNEDGVPFMIFDGQASATGYFFLNFQVTMVDLYQNALGKNDLAKISNLAIIPVAETKQVAVELMKSSLATTSTSCTNST